MSLWRGRFVRCGGGCVGLDCPCCARAPAAVTPPSRARDVSTSPSVLRAAAAEWHGVAAVAAPRRGRRTCEARAGHSTPPPCGRMWRCCGPLARRGGDGGGGPAFRPRRPRLGGGGTSGRASAAAAAVARKVEAGGGLWGSRFM
ncbi:hypothetical protein BU14_0489s0002 [Porphyra umbilicalis]|uniref:Uncharacterized protein n=1 Tax=Porphyra umbilicalis TaxID=2786 RepID=A0A1X6NTI2_PORUM|nr:hypothetical protein BU14_0489s0002 [Porphyra umbilicalis]|eukprot:OSX71924.1 hypothetical protein BU14_0489s0002 [Porphyra umbilicalis]